MRDIFCNLNEIKDIIWAPSHYHGFVGQGFEVVEKYIETQKDKHWREGDNYFYVDFIRYTNFYGIVHYILYLF